MIEPLTNPVWLAYLPVLIFSHIYIKVIHRKIVRERRECQQTGEGFFVTPLETKEPFYRLCQVATNRYFLMTWFILPLLFWILSGL